MQNIKKIRMIYSEQIADCNFLYIFYKMAASKILLSKLKTTSCYIFLTASVGVDYNDYNGATT